MPRPLPLKLSWLVCLLLAGLLLGCGQEPAGKAPSGDLKLEQKAAQLAERMARQRLSALSLAELSSRAGVFPELARSWFQESLSLLDAMERKPALSLAARLSLDKGLKKNRSARAKRLAERLQRLAKEAWPYGLLAKETQALHPDISRRVLEKGLSLALKNRISGQRDLAGLILVMARRERPRALALIAKIDDQAVKSMLYLGLARQEAYPGAYQMAAACAARISDPSAGALFMARAAKAAYYWDRPWSLRIFQRAYDLAAKPQAQAPPELIRAKIAARLAGLDPQAGFKMAQKLGAPAGVGFQAFARAAAGMGAGNQRLADLAWDKALEAAGNLPSSFERRRAWSVLAVQSAAAHPARAQALLARLPSGSVLARGRAQAALALALAGRDRDRAWKIARKIDDHGIRLKVLARLTAASPHLPADEAAKRFRLILKEAARKKIHLDPLLMASAWRLLAPEEACGLAAALPGPLERARALFNLSGEMQKNGLNARSSWCLGRAVQAINSAGSKQILDKVRLLGDMGREWYVIEPEQARSFFERGAEAARLIGLKPPDQK